LRIIGGQLRGKKLNPVRTAAVRPTSDRLREAVFNILAGSIEGTVVLDLFAGTGALGIEALSRGSRKAVFIDHSRDAVALISRNLRLCRLENRSSVIRWDITKNLNCLHRDDQPYDLVFLDPPYDRGLIVPTLQILCRDRLLGSGAHLVVEHTASEGFSSAPESLLIADTRKYGKTLVSFLVAVV
jgi:16S rRNA (guanine966-N2)-methyltransferase